MHIKGIILVVSLLSITTLRAQESQSNSRVTGGHGYFNIGYNITEIDAFNNFITNRGFPALEANMIEYGGSGHAIISNFLIGGQGAGFNGQQINSTNGNYTMNLTGGYGCFDVGYLVFSKKRFLSYFKIGLGAGNYAIQIEDVSDRPSELRQVIEGNTNYSNLTIGGFMLKPAIHLDYFAFGDGGEKGLGGFSIGIEAGYNYAPGDWSWSLNENQNVNSTINLNQNGPFIKISIGGGGYGKSSD